MRGFFLFILNPSQRVLCSLQEFYIPTESSGLSFLKTKLCVATTRGFEVVDLEVRNWLNLGRVCV